MATTPRKKLTQAERVAESAERLSTAAIELIAEQGYERTTTTQIAERAGYSQTMVTARYGSKDALLEHILSTECEGRWFPDLGDATGIDQLLRWMDLLRDEPRREPEITRAFFVLIFEAAGPVPSLRPWTKSWLQRVVDLVTHALRVAEEDGQLRHGVDADAEAELFASAGVGLALRWIVEDDLAHYDNGLSRLRQHFESLRR